MSANAQQSSHEAAQLMCEVEAEREDIISLCAALVGAPSVNPPGDTRQVADVVVAALAQRGISSTLDRCEPTMPSVIADIDSGRPGPHLILNVHLDTMPPGDESVWTQPVWELTRTAGRLYGLGMGNMKGAVAAMVTAASMLHRRRDAWRGRVTFTAVSDEVVFGDNGAAHLLRSHPDLIGDALICGEGPGFRRLAVGEKGVLWLELSATAEGGHSSAVRSGQSATAQIALAVAAVEGLTDTLGTLPEELAALAQSTSPQPAAGPDPGLTLTVNTGTLHGGTFIGQVATNATAQLDLRLPPGVSTSHARELVTRAVANVGSVHVRELKGWDANWTPPSSSLVRAWNRASVALTGAPAVYAIRLPASDASRWRRSGVPGICYGPQPTWSVGVDDYADEEEVLRCAALYTLTALDALQPR